MCAWNDKKALTQSSASAGFAYALIRITYPTPPERIVAPYKQPGFSAPKH